MIHLNNLYDFYHLLFNEKQCKIYEEYYFKNLSLAEIAENNDVSRNAIHKLLKGIEEKLYKYEKNLRLYEKSLKLIQIIEKEKDLDLKKQLKNLL
jgi:predicted DNA-binding protein YlxM (UPF0122 family)